jgi:hypothetical protein
MREVVHLTKVPDKATEQAAKRARKLEAAE